MGPDVPNLVFDNQILFVPHIPRIYFDNCMMCIFVIIVILNTRRIYHQMSYVFTLLLNLFIYTFILQWIEYGSVKRPRKNGHIIENLMLCLLQAGTPPCINRRA